jgi:chromosome segregation protein
MERVSAAVAEVDAIINQQQREMGELEVLSEHRTAEVTAIRVELAKSEQRLDDLRGQLLRYEEDQRERTRALQDVQNQLQQASHRQQCTTQAILDASSAMAELYLAVEGCQQRIEQLTAERHQVAVQRTELHQRTQQLRQAHQQLEELRHRAELDANQVKLERASLAERVRDDYEIELSEVTEKDQLRTEEETREREEIDQEITSLRRKISNIGAVNMAALDEIESLEERHESLATQFQDLSDAKNSLARIIHKINADSRRLFTESLEAIRANFQALFRRVFGGGNADIVLEEDVDILEAGIDIVATPPGKHSLGISLLSGGERALTAVTLLLAIFQYRPSPFCVLDEVDGPLDEANIGRFIDVLTEFLQWTKFVVVTHSKKTMTAATTLYGVTMQESGVSKQVSVQFDDVTEDGHIRRDALQRSAGELPPSGPDNDETGGDERGAA